MVDITIIIEAIIALIVALITTFLIPYLKEKYGNEKLNTIRLWVRVAVEAAEQLFDGDGRGEEKLAYVLNFLEQKGITVDTASLRAMVEAEVLKLKE